MSEFKEFFNLFLESRYPELLAESVEGRITSLVEGGIFSNLGEEYIRGKFAEYEDRGVIPKEILATKKSRGEGTVTRPLSESEKEQVLDYVFRFVDSDVEKALLNLDSYKNDQKVRKKVDKNYSGLATRPAVEDASTISSVLGNYLVIRNKNGAKVPKSLREKFDFQKLAEQVNKAIEDYINVETDGSDSGSGNFVPRGMTVVLESGEYELIKWHTYYPDDEICDLPEDKLVQVSSQRKDLSGGEEIDWCVFYKNPQYRVGDGEPDSNGEYKYPFFLIRKNGKPYALLHGNSLQARQAKSGEPSITQEQADEIWEALLSKPAGGSKNWLEEILKEKL